jgi:hypothetical protein
MGGVRRPTVGPSCTCMVRPARSSRVRRASTTRISHVRARFGEGFDQFISAVRVGAPTATRVRACTASRGAHSGFASLRCARRSRVCEHLVVRVGRWSITALVLVASVSACSGHSRTTAAHTTAAPTTVSLPSTTPRPKVRPKPRTPRTPTTRAAPTTTSMTVFVSHQTRKVTVATLPPSPVTATTPATFWPSNCSSAGAVRSSDGAICTRQSGGNLVWQPKPAPLNIVSAHPITRTTTPPCGYTQGPVPVPCP